MPRFNAAAPSPTKTVNLAGGVAYTETAKLEFAMLLLTSFVSDQFYRKADDTLERVRALLNTVPPEFAAKAALYARDRFGMRSISHAVAAELAHRTHGETWTRPFYERVVIRPDDVTEILSYYMTTYGKRPLPHALRAGLGRGLGKFNAYQLAKYKGEGHALTLVDAVNLLHPKPTEANGEALRLLMKGELKSTETWEAQLSAAGDAETDESKVEAKADAWKGLIASRKLGYFALLRNLRNILEQAPDAVDAACAMLVDETLIRKSRVLPFRYQTAADTLESVTGSRKVMQAIGEAAQIAVANVPVLPGKTLVALDVSGSMRGKPVHIGSLFAAVLYKTQDADLVLFDTALQRVNADPSIGVLPMAREVEQRATGGGTDFRLIFSQAKTPYARVVILSDMQAWVGGGAPMAEHLDYQKRTGVQPHIYSWDLQGYGTLSFPQPQVYALAGFSEKVFDIMAMLEEDRNALVHTIEAVSLTA